VTQLIEATRKEKFTATSHQRCEHCRWCGLRAAVTAQAVLICKKNLPVAHPLVMPGPQGPQLGSITVWPEVQREDSCGAFEAQLS